MPSGLHDRLVPAAPRRTLEELTDDLDLRTGDRASRYSAFWTLLLPSAVIAAVLVASTVAAYLLAAWESDVEQVAAQWLAGEPGAQVIGVRRQAVTFHVSVRVPGGTPPVSDLLARLRGVVPDGVPIVIETTRGSLITAGRVGSRPDASPRMTEPVRPPIVPIMITGRAAENVVAVWGDDGARWLAELPSILAAVARDWDLTVGEPYEPSYHYVTRVVLGDGTPAVLKLGVPSGTSPAEESAALAAFGGRGAVRLLRADLGRGALLLERVVPGRRLRDLVPDRDARATSALAAVMRRLHVPPPPGCPLPDALSQVEAFDGYAAAHGVNGPLPLDLVVRAGGLMRELCASAAERVVLHGDLHHDNVLRATREPWLAIDPHGLVGDPGYDAGTLLYDPDPDDRDEALTALVPARVEQLADELAMPVDRVVAWGFVKAVMSDVWTAEEWTPGAGRSPISRAFDVARLLLPRLT